MGPLKSFFWRKRRLIKDMVPSKFLNFFFLHFPRFYKHPWVNYETNMCPTTFDHFLQEVDSTLMLNGEFIECGSSRGGSAALILQRLKQKKSPKKIWLFDSFKGFSPHEIADQDIDQQKFLTRAFQNSSKGYLERKLGVLGFAGKFNVIEGYFEETLKDNLPNKVCFAFIDCDLKQSIQHCLEIIWPRVVQGGKIIVDDYLSPMYPGAKEAVDSFMTTKRGEILGRPMNALYLLEKIL